MQTGPIYLTEDDLYNFGTTQLHDFGVVGVTSDGRQFRYTLFGGTSTVAAGKLLVAAAAPSNSTGLAIPSTQPNTGTSLTALESGSLTFNVTNGSTAVTANEFQYVEINQATDGHYRLRLNGNTAAATSGTITLSLKDPIPQGATTLVAGTDTVNLRYAPWNAPTASTTAALPVGVTPYAVPNTSSVSNYGWVQTVGPAFVYSAGSLTKGDAVVQDTSNAGGVANAGSYTAAVVGTAIETSSSAPSSVYLTLV